jgi:hypothetical protein
VAYYKEIKGKKYDGALLDLADKLVGGKGDGRISEEDAKKLLKAVKDGDAYTEVEKATVSYLRSNYKWTEAADSWFRTEVSKWAATK